MNSSKKWNFTCIVAIIIVFGLGSLATISPYIISHKTKNSVAEESTATVVHLPNNADNIPFEPTF